METRERFSKIILIIFIFFSVFNVLQFLAPLMLPTGSIKDLTGHSLISDNDQKIKNNSPLNFMYGIGDRLCHQKSERSYFINGNQMPFCARCTAIWIGIMIGLGIMIFYKIEFDEKILILLLVGIAPLAIDGIGQLANMWESTNLIRSITGLLTGYVTGIALGVIIDELRDIYHHKK